uniref:Uncharacterized protein n=1 Tax=Arundo donax TaxID=35708 RepID=A0A0A8YBJ3_ARUDO
MRGFFGEIPPYLFWKEKDASFLCGAALFSPLKLAISTTGSRPSSPSAYSKLPVSRLKGRYMGRRSGSR